MFVNQLISALLRTVLFLTIPLIWWLVTGRRGRGFFSCMAGGSLWPSYLIHAVANVFGAGLVLAGIV